jgi:hypothetical protein
VDDLDVRLLEAPRDGNHDARALIQASQSTERRQRAHLKARRPPSRAKHAVLRRGQHGGDAMGRQPRGQQFDDHLGAAALAGGGDERHAAPARSRQTHR